MNAHELGRTKDEAFERGMSDSLAQCFAGYGFQSIESSVVDGGNTNVNRVDRYKLIKFNRDIGWRVDGVRLTA